MAAAPATRDRIARLRWRGGGDALAARRALERALAAFAWQPDGATIVCVRRLRGALQRSGALAGRDGRPWREELEALAAHAPRPWREPVPANAEAVWFADEVELLACLAVDVARGRAGAAWWWPALLGTRADREQWWRRWTQAPELLPVVLCRLAARDEVSAVLAAMAPQESQSLLRMVAATHAVDEVWLNTGQQPATVLPQSPWTAAMNREAMAVRAQVQMALGALPETMPHAARLLTLALVLVERPRWLRVPGFAVLMERVTRESTLPVGVPPDFGPEVDDAHRIAPTPAAPTARRLASHQPLDAAAPVRSASVPAPAIAPVTERAWPVPATPTQAGAPARLSFEGETLAPRAGASARPRAADATPALATELRAEPSRLHADSAHAGTLYLLPIAVHLGWYGNFTQPRARGLALHPADLLALLAQHLLGTPWAADPLARLLAAWAGRAPDEPPGRDFVPDDGQSLDEWVAQRAQALAARAAEALGEPADAVLPWLTCRPGRVSLTDTELVARFDLASHPLAIRLAGLDRDLGWLPAGGRSVRFQFDLLSPGP